MEWDVVCILYSFHKHQQIDANSHAYYLKESYFLMINGFKKSINFDWSIIISVMNCLSLYTASIKSHTIVRPYHFKIPIGLHYDLTQGIVFNN